MRGGLAHWASSRQFSGDSFSLRSFPFCEGERDWFTKSGNVSPYSSKLIQDLNIKDVIDMRSSNEELVDLAESPHNCRLRTSQICPGHLSQSSPATLN